MAFEIIALCYNNIQVFRGEVKLGRGELYPELSHRKV